MQPFVPRKVRRRRQRLSRIAVRLVLIGAAVTAVEILYYLM